jgi:hypothetical protein
MFGEPAAGEAVFPNIVSLGAVCPIDAAILTRGWAWNGRCFYQGFR